MAWACWWRRTSSPSARRRLLQPSPGQKQSQRQWLKRRLRPDSKCCLGRRPQNASRARCCACTTVRPVLLLSSFGEFLKGSGARLTLAPAQRLWSSSGSWRRCRRRLRLARRRWSASRRSYRPSGRQPPCRCLGPLRQVRAPRSSVTVGF